MIRCNTVAAKFILLVYVCLASAIHAHDGETMDHYHGSPPDLSKEPTLKELVEVAIFHDSMGIEVINPEIEQIKTEICKVGDKAAPIIIQMLQSVEEMSLAIPMIMLLGSLELEDKDVIRRTYQQILSGKLEVPDQNFLLTHKLARMVRVFGDPSDTDWVLPLLDHEKRSVRVMAAQSLGIIGDLTTADKIKRALAARAARLSSDEIAQDKVFKYGTTAIEAIKQRYPSSVAPTSSDSPKKLDAIESKPEKTEPVKVEHLENNSSSYPNTRNWLLVAIIAIVTMLLIRYWTKFNSSSNETN